jgi:2-keto-3-deoxy-L-rhamnonate aldolase RhmA
MVDLGFDFVTVGTDLGLAAAGAARELAMVRVDAGGGGAAGKPAY